MDPFPAIVQEAKTYIAWVAQNAPDAPATRTLARATVVVVVYCPAVSALSGDPAGVARLANQAPPTLRFEQVLKINVVSLVPCVVRVLVPVLLGPGVYTTAAVRKQPPALPPGVSEITYRFGLSALFAVLHLFTHARKYASE